MLAKFLNKMIKSYDMVYDTHLLIYRTTPNQAEFRFFWGSTKFREDLVGIGKIQNKNAYPMFWLPHVLCDKASLTTIIHKTQPFEVDGLLFYHKQ